MNYKNFFNLFKIQFWNFGLLLEGPEKYIKIYYHILVYYQICRSGNNQNILPKTIYLTMMVNIAFLLKAHMMKSWKCLSSDEKFAAEESFFIE